MTQGDLPPLPPQHPGGFIWEPHAGRMRIVTDAEWGALADDLLPMVREAAATLANPLIRGANIHPMIVERAARLTELLSGDMAEVAARVPRVYMASLWLAEKYDTDRKLRGANDPMGEPLSDEMRAALVDLMAVLPSFVRQFPKVLQIEADREDFFADALQLDAAERAATGAEEARLIAPEDAQPLTEGVAAARGEGPLADRAGRSVVRSLRNLASAGFVAGAVFGHVTGFVSGEVIGGIADGVGIEIRAPMGRWVRGRHEDIQTLFATAPPDLRLAIAQHVDALMKPGPIPAPPARPTPKPRTWIVDPDPAKGDFTLIQPAIDAADPGDRILVREGTYREPLRLSKELEIVGDGDVERILVTTDKGNALLVDAPMARVTGLRLRREAGGDNYGVWITGGAVSFGHCILENDKGTGITASGKAARVMVGHCQMRSSSGYGALVMDMAELAMEECQIIGNQNSGIWVQDHGTSLSAIRCLLESNGRYGVYVGSGSRARVDDCEIIANQLSGIWVQRGGNVEGSRNKIADNGMSAIVVMGASTGTFRNNDLRGNGKGPWDIAEGATVIDEGNLT